MILLLSLVLVDAVAAQIAFYLGAELYSAAISEETAFGFGPELAGMALICPSVTSCSTCIGYTAKPRLNAFPCASRRPVCCSPCWWAGSTRASAYSGRLARPLTFAFVVVLPLIGESIIRTILIRRKLWGVPAVVIGAGPTGQQVVRILQQMPELGLRPVGFFDDHHADDEGPPAAVENLPVLGSIADSVRYSRRIETAIVDTGEGAGNGRRRRHAARLSLHHRCPRFARTAHAGGADARSQRTHRPADAAKSAAETQPPPQADDGLPVRVAALHRERPIIAAMALWITRSAMARRSTYSSAQARTDVPSRSGSSDDVS